MKLYYVSPGRLITETGEEVEGIMSMVATWETRGGGFLRSRPIQDPIAQVQITLLLECVEDLPEVDVETTVQELIQLEGLLSDADLRSNKDEWNPFWSVTP